MNLSREHLAELIEAHQLLEHPGLAIKVANLVGAPLERGFEMLPAGWSDRIGRTTREALMVALKGALLTMRRRPGQPSVRWHRVAAATSGAVGGALGLSGLAIELPLSTLIICRSIADIARAQGESLDDLDTRLACLEVFGLGGPTQEDDHADGMYFAARAAMSKTVAEAAEFLSSHALLGEGAPTLVRMVGAVASRFQIQVSEKVAAQAIPVIGAASGAVINLLFIEHFQGMSHGHFTIRRLSRLYGESTVRAAYRAVGEVERQRAA